jgi:hypothetical protein
MTSVVFIHGTGVREPHFTDLCARIAEGLRPLAPAAHVVPYDWGTPHGARLGSKGASIPGPGRGADSRDPRAPGDTADSADAVAEAWARLYREPTSELALAAAGSGAVVTPPGAAFPDERPRALLGQLASRADEFGELGPGIDEAALALARDPLLPRAAQALDAVTLAATLARALAATAIGRALAEDLPVICDGDTRDAAVERLARALGAPPHGTERGPVLKLLGRPVVSAGSHYAVRRRRALTEAAHPAAGDILRYLARGEPMRHGLRLLVATLEPPVVLLGHSLGGIIALDTLLAAPLPGVELLVTVGSQGPFLYETGALPGLEHPDPLPGHVPPWLNLHDRRDLLGHIGAPVFPGRVTDVETDNRQPFPAAHSAYWSNPAVYRTIAEQLP